MTSETSVQLCCDKQQWKKLPVWAQESINAGVKRITRLRKQIATDSKVKIVPPVDCLAKVWITDDFCGSVGGTYTSLARGDLSLIGVRLPAQTVCITDENYLRGILVHEFSHCFQLMQTLLNNADEGIAAKSCVTSPNNIFTDEQWEMSQHVCLQDWFGKTDVDLFVKWNDARFETLCSPFVVKWVNAGLPREQPDTKICAKIRIPPEIVDYVRSLRK